MEGTNLAVYYQVKNMGHVTGLTLKELKVAHSSGDCQDLIYICIFNFISTGKVRVTASIFIFTSSDPDFDFC